LNQANLKYVADMKAAKEANNDKMAFFISPDKSVVEYDPAITSFYASTSRATFSRAAAEYWTV
jgi:hypothetical protein